MAAIAGAGHMDPAKNGKYPIVISEELLRQESPRKRQRINVQYNHRPKTLNGQPASIKSAHERDNDHYTLRIKSEDGHGNYKYRGEKEPSISVALIYNPAEDNFRLEKIDAGMLFNLQSTPFEKDSRSLESRYPQLGATRQVSRAKTVAGAVAGEEGDPADEDLHPDESNPYDYRHFLNRDGSPSPAPSNQGSPYPHHAFNSSPLVRPSSPAPKSKVKSRPRKRSPPRISQRYLSPHPPEEDQADNEESDPSELVIDMGEPTVTKTKPWRVDLGNALNSRGRSTGPISFRSAASSMSPSVRGRSSEEKDEHDKDVEEIDLGSPRVGGGDSVKREQPDTATNNNGWDADEDDMLEAELQQAMEQEAEDAQAGQQNQPLHAPAESSSESEEE